MRDIDFPEIILDEWLGQWIALLPMLYFNPYLAQTPEGFSFVQTLFLLGLSFALFRFFDIKKPWPIDIIDKKNKPWSVLLDDVVAGAFSAAILHLIMTAWLWL